MHHLQNSAKLAFVMLAAFMLVTTSIVSTPLAFAEDRDTSGATNVSGISKTGVTTTALDIAQAMGISPAIIDTVEFANAPDGTPTNSDFGAEVLSTAVSGFATQGTTFSALSSGCAIDIYNPNESSSHTCVLEEISSGPGHDVTTFRAVLNVPSGSQSLSFDWKFFSDEYPEYVGSGFNDFFITELHSGNVPHPTYTFDDVNVVAPANIAFDSSGNLITINTTGALGMSEGQASGTTYDGATGILSTKAAIPTGAKQITLFFTVGDVSDHAWDSTVLLDNFKFSGDKVTNTDGAVTSTKSPELTCDVFLQGEIASLEDSPIFPSGSTIGFQATLTDPSTGQGIPEETLKFTLPGTGVSQKTDLTDANGDAATTFDLSNLDDGFYQGKVEFAAHNNYNAASCFTQFLVGEGTGTFELLVNGNLDKFNLPIVISSMGTKTSFAEAVDLDGDGTADTVVFANELIAGPAFEEEPPLLDDAGQASVTINSNYALDVDSMFGHVTLLPGSNPIKVVTAFFFDSDEFEEEPTSLSASKLSESAFSFTYLIAALDNDDNTSITDAVGQAGQGSGEDFASAVDCDITGGDEEELSEEFDCDPSLMFVQLEDNYITYNSFHEDSKKESYLKGGVKSLQTTSGNIFFEVEGEAKIKKINYELFLEIEGAWQQTEGEDVELLGAVETFSGEITLMNTSTEDHDEHTVEVTDVKISGKTVTIKGTVDGDEKNKFNATLKFNDGVTFEDGSSSSLASKGSTVKFNIGKTTYTFSKGVTGSYEHT